MTVSSASTRLKLNGRQVDSLIQHGMQKFDEANIYVSPSKMSKLVRETARARGFEWAKFAIDSYFEARELITWESYARALGGAAIYSDGKGGWR